MRGNTKVISVIALGIEMSIGLGVGLTGTSVWGQELPSYDPSSTAKLPSENKAENQRADIDDEITNARLRAATGAKSLFSLQTAFTYNGGSINTPLSEDRPQLSPGTVENDPAKLTGTVAAKYRLTDHDNLNLGVGVGWLTPAYSGQKGQIEDPYVGYSRTFRVGDVQNVLNTQMTKYTADSSVEQNLSSEFEIDHTVMTSIGKTKWQIGVDIAWSHEFYTAAPPSAAGVEDEFAAFPLLEYEFNSRYSFRTVYRGLTYFSTTADPASFQQDAVTQSVGIGIAVTRDCYLYPNVQAVLTDLRPEKTNVGISANINAF